MDTPRKRNMAARLWVTLRFLGVVLGACVVVMTVFYYAGYWYARNRIVPPHVSQAEIDDALKLQEWSNRLMELTGEYQDRIRKERPPLSDAFTIWCRQEFVPRVAGVRRLMSSHRSKNSALHSLLRAADAVNAMATRPEDASLRTTAIEEVFDASAEVENHLMTLGFRQHVERMKERR
ncbi:MAG: hypothetical protein AMXMBFR4_01530 [Candidatus Hydrogenedentota bacterium]